MYNIDNEKYRISNKDNCYYNIVIISLLEKKHRIKLNIQIGLIEFYMLYIVFMIVK